MCTPVIPALRKLRQKDHKIEATWNSVKGKGGKRRKRGRETKRQRKEEERNRHTILLCDFHLNKRNGLVACSMLHLVLIRELRCSYSDLKFPPELDELPLFF